MRPADLRVKRRRDPESAKAEACLGPSLGLADDVLRLRLERGWTQAELARRVGTRQANISRLENGLSNPTLKFLQRVSDVLGEELLVRFVPQDTSPAPDARAVEVRSDAVAD